MADRTRSARPPLLWVVFLAGPVIGSGYFFLVYLAAEATCAQGLQLFATTTLRVIILAATAASAAAAIGYGWRAQRLRRETFDANDDGGEGRLAENRRFMGSAGLMLAGLFVLFVLLVGAPAIGSTLC